MIETDIPGFILETMPSQRSARTPKLKLAQPGPTLHALPILHVLPTFQEQTEAAEVPLLFVAIMRYVVNLKLAHVFIPLA